MVVMATLLQTSKVLQFERCALELSVKDLADPRVRKHSAHTQHSGGAPSYWLPPSDGVAQVASVRTPVQLLITICSKKKTPANGYTSR